jgi:hypothetical protein
MICRSATRAVARSTPCIECKVDLASETYSTHTRTPVFRATLDFGSTGSAHPNRQTRARKNKTPRDRDLLGFRRHCWRRRRDSNPRSRFWPRCSLSRGVPSTSRPRLPNFLPRRESARRSQDNSGPNREGQCLRHIFCARFVIDDAISSHWPQRTHEARTGRSCTSRFLRQITPDPARTPYAAHARRAPYTSRRSAPKS